MSATEERVWEVRFRRYLIDMIKDFAHEALWYAEEADQLVAEVEFNASKHRGDETFRTLERLVSVITKSANIVWPRKKEGLSKIRGRAIRLICGFPDKEDQFLKGLREFRNAMTHVEERLEFRRYREMVVFGMRNNGNLERLYDVNALIPEGRIAMNGRSMEFYLDLNTLQCHVFNEIFDLRFCGSEPRKIATKMTDALFAFEHGFDDFSDECATIVALVKRDKRRIASREQMKKMISVAKEHIGT